nr:nucleotidyltransferase domain-containing protein [Bacillus altitudinis]
MRKRIKEELKIIEETCDVKIFLAVESGSRAEHFDDIKLKANSI